MQEGYVSLMEIKCLYTRQPYRKQADWLQMGL